MQMGAINTKQSKFKIKDLLLLPKLFLVITVVLIMWVVIVLSGPMFGVFEPDWAGLSPSLWLLMVSIFIGIFIVIDIILYATPRFFVDQSKLEFSTVELPEIENRNGKQVHEFTYPVGVKGGLLSKTYFKIKQNKIFRIRNLMIKKEEIWKK